MTDTSWPSFVQRGRYQLKTSTNRGSAPKGVKQVGRGWANDGHLLTVISLVQISEVLHHFPEQWSKLSELDPWVLSVVRNRYKIGPYSYFVFNNSAIAVSGSAHFGRESSSTKGQSKE